MSLALGEPVVSALRRRRRAWSGIGVGGALLLLLAVGSLGVGAVRIPPGRVVDILLREIGIPVGTNGDAATMARERAVVLAIRAPRVVAALLIGATLASSGVALQGLFRNPLAAPSLVGVSSGAAFAAAGAIVLAPLRGLFWVTPVAAFAGAILATFLVYALATRTRTTDMTTLLLAGLAINALCGAGTGLFTFVATDSQLRDIAFWSLGSLGGVTWKSLAVAGPVMLVSIVALPRFARELNMLMLGEREASHLGANVQLVKVAVITLVSAAVGAAVAVSGIIGFVGLVAPHLVRLAIGPTHRTLLPGAAVGGALLLLLADFLARTVVVPAELPIGIVTSFVGGPFFIWLLLRYRTRGGRDA